MVSFVESDAMDIIEWYPPCSSPQFLNSCMVYQHQHLGLHSYQMVELASYLTADLTMVNFWILHYTGEQANYVQTRASSSTASQQAQVTQQNQQPIPAQPDLKRGNTPVVQP